MDKKKAAMTLGVIIAIALGIAMLMLFLFGLSSEGDNLFNKVVSLGGGSSVDSVKKACDMACSIDGVYEYCERVWEVDFGEGEIVEGNCRDFEGDDRFGLKECNIICDKKIEELEEATVEENEKVEDDEETDSEEEKYEITIEGKVVLKGLTNYDTPVAAKLFGVNFDDDSDNIRSNEENGVFEFSSDVVEQVWWFEQECENNLPHSPTPSYIEISELDEFGFVLNASGYENKISFDDFSEDRKFVVNIGDFPVYRTWSIRMRSLGNPIYFTVFYDTEDGVRGFPHGTATLGVTKFYILPLERNFYVRVVEEDGSSYVSTTRSIPKDSIRCGMVDLIYTEDHGFEWELGKYGSYTG